ncbi:MAG: Na(+)-translocating NADH-quinone reductase subunit A [Thermoguttaceae bacterium]
MKTIKIKKGCNIPLAGEPEQRIYPGRNLARYSVTASDYVGLKPTFHVAVGDYVKMGQLLFEDKKNPGVLFTSPCCGTVKAIVRGEKRAFRELVLDRDENGSALSFRDNINPDLVGLPTESVKKRLIESGLWTALRTRPFSKIPNPATLPNSLFVTAIDTHPLAADPIVVISERQDEFVDGLRVLSSICGKKLYLCVSANCSNANDSDATKSNGSKSGANEYWEKLPTNDVPKLEKVAFAGPHPAGLPGTHIHFLDSVGGSKTNWYIGYQDVIAIGKLFKTGELDLTRVVSLAGPQVKQPRLIRTRIGACLQGLTHDELKVGPNRVISGSVLAGRTATSDAIPETEWVRGLGRYHTQISVIEEMKGPQLFGWVEPGFSKFSLTGQIASSFLPRSALNLNTAEMGGHRAIFPVKELEAVMPLDILPIFLCRALEIGDIEQSEALGALELDEEDLALCTFADPGKNDFGANLRSMLNLIAKEETEQHH